VPTCPPWSASEWLLQFPSEAEARQYSSERESRQQRSSPSADELPSAAARAPSWRPIRIPRFDRRKSNRAKASGAAVGFCVALGAAWWSAQYFPAFAPQGARRDPPARSSSASTPVDGPRYFPLLPLSESAALAGQALQQEPPVEPTGNAAGLSAADEADRGTRARASTPTVGTFAPDVRDAPQARNSASRATREPEPFAPRLRTERMETIPPSSQAGRFPAQPDDSVPEFVPSRRRHRGSRRRSSSRSCRQSKAWAPQCPER
jgi:hypothetical protein